MSTVHVYGIAANGELVEARYFHWSEAGGLTPPDLDGIRWFNSITEARKDRRDRQIAGFAGVATDARHDAPSRKHDPDEQQVPSVDK